MFFRTFHFPLREFCRRYIRLFSGWTEQLSLSLHELYHRHIENNFIYLFEKRVIILIFLTSLASPTHSTIYIFYMRCFSHIRLETGDGLNKHTSYDVCEYVACVLNDACMMHYIQPWRWKLHHITHRRQLSLILFVESDWFGVNDIFHSIQQFNVIAAEQTLSCSIGVNWRTGGAFNRSIHQSAFENCIASFEGMFNYL